MSAMASPPGLPELETPGEALRRYFRIGARTPRRRRGRDMHQEVIEAILYAATAPGYFTERTESALRPAYAVALSWQKHVQGYRLPGHQIAVLTGLSPYQLTVLVDRMTAAGVTNVGEGERWFRNDVTANFPHNPPRV